MNTNIIKKFHIVNFKKVGIYAVSIHYVSGAYREFRVHNYDDIPKSIKEALASGLFGIVNARNSDSVSVQWYELK